MRRHAVFRADASPTIGGGHIMRCLALADHLATEGWACTFVVCSETLDSVAALRASPHAVRLAAAPDDAAVVRDCAPVDVLIVDHYRLNNTFEMACRDGVCSIVVIDDLADRPHDADILVDVTLGRDAADYRALVRAGCRLLIGPSFALLRPEFAVMRERALSRRQQATPHRFLVCMGNSDPHDMTSLALDAIESCGRPLEVDVVLGGRSPNRAAVEARVAKLGPAFRLHVDTSEIARLMCDADLAIGSCGTVSWERCVLGLPAIGVVTADNQRLIAQGLATAGAIACTGVWNEITGQDMGRQLDRLLSAPERLVAMVAEAAQICDGGGAARVAQAITEIAA